ncbi:hypothetical protein GA830_04305 [Mesorhizobium sp. NBSH29]|uniref:hypothetical protein n=1 Tax=Mesorhizobium sp. NBSH29 TaxID=2654249 RepID=UPI0018964C05|nr:hypothetical protein [Mesorhizobium sp. NBSH29]QPC86046.1 hypothetical protein GA830_04305 [Mesorhizobium sp. NBSH29]
MSTIKPVHDLRHGPLGLFGIALLAISVAGCVAADSGNGGKTRERVAAYNCGEDGRLTVERRGASVILTQPEGAPVELPASPPGQTARFGEAPYALVLEEREALLMKNGSAPLTCTR